MNSENFEGKNLHLIPEVTDWAGAVRGMFANRANPAYVEEPVALFDEKGRSSTNPQLRAESTYSFYDRSSLEEFAGVRRMLQRWVDRFPPEKQRDIVGRMRHKGPGSPVEQQSFDGAFFELFLNEFLNGTGADTVVDPQVGGKTPDFGVTEGTPNGKQITYVVEATDVNVVYDAEFERTWNEQRALDIIDEIESPDFLLSVETEGTLDTMPRKRELKRPFEELARNSNYDYVSAKAELYGYFNDALPGTTFRCAGWAITGHLIPVPPESRPRKGRFIGVGPTSAGSINDAGKAKTRLYDKAKSYQSTGDLVIALRCNGLMDRIDEALFGHMEYQIPIPKDSTYTGPLPPARNVQKPDGFWFNASSPLNQHVIGVVAFYDLHPHCIDKATAVFYANPYTDKPLPSWTTEVTHAEYNDGKIKLVEGVRPGAFAKDHEPWTNVRFHWE